MFKIKAITIFIENCVKQIMHSLKIDILQKELNNLLAKKIFKDLI